MEMKILEKKGKKQLLFIPQFEEERKMIEGISTDKFLKMKVSKSKFIGSGSLDIILLTESHS